MVKSDFTLLGQWDFSEEGSSSDVPSQNRGHDNVHDDMNMYVIMHDQCLFIAMINSFHT